MTKKERIVKLFPGINDFEKMQVFKIVDETLSVDRVNKYSNYLGATRICDFLGIEIRGNRKLVEDILNENIQNCNQFI